MPLSFPQTNLRRTESNSFAFVGDSRLAQMFADASTSTTFPSNGIHLKTNHWFNVANALMGQRMKIVYNGAISGGYTYQYLANLPAAIASGASWLVMWSVINDINNALNYGDTALTIWTRLKNACIQALNSGMNVILLTEPGNTALTDYRQLGMIYQVNEYMREFCAVTPGMFLFDAANVMVSPTASSSSTLALNANYSTDGIHPNGYGSWYLGNAFANQFSNFIPPNPSLIVSANESQTNGNVQQTLNPLLLTTTGGNSQTGVTGNTPANFQTIVTGSATATVSSSADSSGYGNIFTMACTFGAAGDSCNFGSTNNNLAGVSIGDVIDSGCEIIVNAGATNLNGVYLKSTCYGASGYAWPTDLYPLNGQALPGVAMDLTLRAVPITVPVGTTIVCFNLVIVASGAGSATVSVKRPWLRRRFAI